MGRVRTTAALALVGALAVAVVGVVVLGPQAGPAPARIDPAAYFTPAELQRAADFRVAQRWIAVGQLLAQALAVAVVAAVVRRRARTSGRRPGDAGARRGRRIWRRPARRPLLRAAAAGAAVTAFLSAAAVPFGAAARVRALDAGLATGSWGLWTTDVVRGIAITAVGGAIAGAVVVILARRFGRSWWAPASVLAIGAAVAITFVQPVVLEPLANDFRPASDPALTAEVQRLAARSGVEVGGVEVLDASRRTSGINAYVTGFGPSRRVALYDTLLERLPAPAVRAVVAHELAHVSSHDVRRGLLFAALVIPLGLLAAARLAETLGEDDEGRGPSAGGGTPAGPGIAALVVAVTIVAVPLVVAGNVLSREVEAHADARALAVTGDPQGMIDLQVGLAVANRSDPDPPGYWQALLGTHPTTAERIGMAVAAQRLAADARDGGGDGDRRRATG